MTSTSSHAGAGPPSRPAPAAPSTYGTQTLPIAVPLPDFWRQQPAQQPSTHPHRQIQQHTQPVYHYVNVNPHLNAASAGSAVMHQQQQPHHAWPAPSSSSRSHHQQHDINNTTTQPSPNLPTTINAYPQPLQSSQPTVYYAQPQSHPSYVYYNGPASTTDNHPSSASSSALPIQYHHYPVASTSSNVQAPKQEVKPASLPLSARQNFEKENVRPASPKPTKKPSQQRDRSATLDIPPQDADTPTAADDVDSYDDAELSARFSSVSQIEAQPTLDPETGEAVYPCPFCDKHYGGKHARSIWRRHLSNKHGIPLNIQPRRTRWDNDANRPKDEAERHKRTLESKRRWAAKNRAEKRAKRKGTTVEEELGLIEAAEAAEAAAKANGTTIGNGSVYDDDDNAGDESFNSQDGQTSSGSIQPLNSQNQPVQQIQHQQSQGYWQDVRQSRQAQQPMQTPITSYTTSAPVQYAEPHRGQQSMHPDPQQIQHLRYASHPSSHTDYLHQVSYLEGDAGHQPYTVIYPAYAVSPDPNASARFQRSPSQPEFSTHVQQGTPYATSVSPVDGSFAQQQVQYLQPVFQQVPAQHSNQQGQSAGPRLLQTVPLAQQPFLAPPSSMSQTSSTLQRSVSAPLTASGPVYNRQNPPRLHQIPPPSNATPSGTPISHVQHYVQDPRYAAQEDARHSEASTGAAPPARPPSSNGMTIYIPPPPQAIQAWSNSAEQATPLAHPVPLYANNQGQHPQDGQMPPTPYFYLSVPGSTPVAHQQTPVAYATQQSASVEVQQTSEAASQPAEQAGALTARAPVHERPQHVEQHSALAAPEENSAQRTKKSVTVQKQSVNNSHSTKTYQEAAMQLLALKTASSSPPASPVKEYFNGDEEEDEEDEEEPNDELVEMWRSTDGEGSSLAEVEDSGFGAYGEDASMRKPDHKQGAAELEMSTEKEVHNEAQDDDDEEEEQERRELRFASIPPSSPAPRMSLSPESSPMPVVPSKLSATYLRAQASASRSTPIGLKKRKVGSSHKRQDNARQAEDSSDVEIDENEHQEDDDDDENDDGERISLDSSPEREDEEMKAPLAKRRLISMSSASPRSRIRGGHVTSTATSNSRSPSPSRYTSAGSSFSTSVIMSTPHLGNENTTSHSQAPDGLFYSGIGATTNMQGGNNIGGGISKRGYSHHHRSSIFKIDNCSRPSAGLGMSASSSSPSRPFLLSSPEHAGLSRSLGLVPDNFNFAHSTSLSMSLPSDSEGFEMHFLNGYDRHNNNGDTRGANGTSLKKGQKGGQLVGKGNNNGGMGLSEYAKDVLGGPLSGL